MVPTLSCATFWIFASIWSDCSSDCCSGCCFGVVCTFFGNGSQGFEETFWSFFGLNVFSFSSKLLFLMLWILLGRSSPKSVLNQGLHFLFNCWYVLSSLLTSANLCWCVYLLLVCPSNAMASVAIFISHLQVYLYSFPKRFLSSYI